MGRKKTHAPEEIVAKLRHAEVLGGQGKTVTEAIRTIGVTEPTHYRWGTGVWWSEAGPSEAAEGVGARERAAAEGGVGPNAREGHSEGSRLGKVVSPARRRACVEHVVRELGVSERKACAVLGQHRSTQRKAPRGSDDEAALTADIVELAKRYGRYGYRRITALLRDAGWAVNRKRVERVRGTASDADGSGAARG
jgi:putative transposase